MLKENKKNAMEFVMIFKLFNTNLKDMTLKTKKKGGVMSLILQGPYLRGKKSYTFSQNIC